MLDVDGKLERLYIIFLDKHLTCRHANWLDAASRRHATYRSPRQHTCTHTLEATNTTGALERRDLMAGLPETAQTPPDRPDPPDRPRPPRPPQTAQTPQTACPDPP
jgi:hypothetical protein